MADNLVIVESPAKAKTIKKYLGKDFEVLASYGHVRDLVPKEGAVNPDKHFAMNYQSIERNEKHVDAIARALKKSKNLYLATDPDREGEAISWHLRELLEERGDLKGKEVKRVVFYEITKGEVQRAVAEPRDLSLDLVNAQQARRALDYLVGFNLSPLLWKKVRRGLSAGRVQSPALRMICEREHEISHLQAAGILDARSRRRTQHPDLPAQAGRIRRQESRAVQLHQRSGRARRRAIHQGCRAGLPARHLHRPQAAPAQSLTAVHHFDAAAGSRAQAGLLRAAHHAPRAAALRRRGLRRRQHRSHHLHAHRLA